MKLRVFCRLEIAKDDGKVLLRCLYFGRTKEYRDVEVRWGEVPTFFWDFGNALKVEDYKSLWHVSLHNT